VEEIGALFVHGGEIWANGAEGFKVGLCAEATGDFLFELGYAYGLLCKIVGKGNIVIGHEAPDIVGIVAQAIDEIEGPALLGSTALAGRRRTRIDGLSLGENLVVGATVVLTAIRCQRSPDLIEFMTGRNKQIAQSFSPSLFHLLDDVGRFAQVVCIKQAVDASQITVRFPTVVD